MNKGTLDNHLEMLMPVEMQHDIGCDAEEPYAHRDVSQRVMRIINRCVEQAEQIRERDKMIATEQANRDRWKAIAKKVEAQGAEQIATLRGDRDRLGNLFKEQTKTIAQQAEQLADYKNSLKIAEGEYEQLGREYEQLDAKEDMEHLDDGDYIDGCP